MKEKLNRLARRITLRQLRALAAVVETGTVTGAADRLAVTAPAISAQIRLLEDLSGLPLIERQAQGMTATRAGRELLAAFELIEAALSDCTAALESLCGGEGGPVAVGSTSTTSPGRRALTAALSTPDARRTTTTIGCSRTSSSNE